MPQRELARLAKIDRSSISNIERGMLGIGEERASRIAKALRMDRAELLAPRAEAVTLGTILRRLEAIGDSVERGFARLEGALEAGTSAQDVRQSDGAVRKRRARGAARK